jgi:cytochrome c oxidase subunit 2
MIDALKSLGYLFFGRLLSQGDGGFWMPAQRSTYAGDVDSLFFFIFWISLFFFLLIVALMTVFVIRYRARPGHKAQPRGHHNLPLELSWSIIPTILVVVIFFWGFKSYMKMAVPPQNAYEIQVTGQKWQWLFTYANGHVDPDLHVPADRPVLLVMTSEDVIHSFYVPAFRMKHDVVPGRYSKLWFRAPQPGEYQVFCAEYCGTNHSNMLAKVIVHEPGMFEKWLEEAGNFLDKLPPAEGGEKLYEQRGCKQCHTVDGTRLIGPTFKNVFGRKEALTGGGTITVDENYIRESILDPQAKVVAGFDPVMPTYQGKMKDKEITALIAYMKSLSGIAPGEWAEGGKGAAAEDSTGSKTE